MFSCHLMSSLESSLGVGHLVSSHNVALTFLVKSSHVESSLSSSRVIRVFQKLNQLKSQCFSVESVRVGGCLMSSHLESLVSEVESYWECLTMYVWSIPLLPNLLDVYWNVNYTSTSTKVLRTKASPSLEERRILKLRKVICDIIVVNTGTCKIN